MTGGNKLGNLDNDDDDDDDGENVDEVLDSFARSHWEWEDKQTAPSAFIVHSLLPIMTR